MLLCIYLHLSNYFPVGMETCDSEEVIKRGKEEEKQTERERRTDVNIPPNTRDKMLCCSSRMSPLIITFFFLIAFSLPNNSELATFFYSHSITQQKLI